MSHYLLYHTLGCHLCELAEECVEVSLQILSKTSSKTSSEEQRPTFQKVDIANDEALIERYGIRIPVIVSQRSGAELNWPFDSAALMKWLAVN